MKNIVVTAGGTSEYIDTVRKITNSGTGKLGAEIADRLADDYHVIYIHTKGSVIPNVFEHDIEVIEVVNVAETKQAIEDVFNTREIDWFIHTMAVSDYSVDYVSSATKLYNHLSKNGLTVENIVHNTDIYDVGEKISSKEDDIVIKLRKTPKIINMVKKVSPKTHLIGFKLLTDVSREDLISAARKLQDDNQADYVVANDLKTIREGYHEAYLVNKDYVSRIGGKPMIAATIKEIIRSDRDESR